MIAPAKAGNDPIHRVFGKYRVATLVERLGALRFFVSTLLVLGNDSSGFVEVTPKELVS
jgi:hypothetical protein